MQVGSGYNHMAMPFFPAKIQVEVKPPAKTNTHRSHWQFARNGEGLFVSMDEAPSNPQLQPITGLQACDGSLNHI